MKMRNPKSLMSESKMKFKAEMDTLIAKMDLLNNNIDAILAQKTNAVDDYLSKMEGWILEFLGALENAVCGEDVK